MAFDYAKSAATAARLLARFGAAAILRKKTPEAYTNGAITSTTTNYTGVGATFDYTQREVQDSGGNIRIGDQKMLLSAYLSDGATAMPIPKTGDTISFNSVIYTVHAVENLSPSAVNVMYTVQLRGAA